MTNRQKKHRNVVEHIDHIYKEGELNKEATCRNFRQVRLEGTMYSMKIFNPYHPRAIITRQIQFLFKYDKVEKNLLKSTLIVPNRLYPWYLLCKLHAETGQQEKVDEMADIVQTKEPKVQSPAVREMREEVRKLKTKN
jgi:hypothetical protein